MRLIDVEVAEKNWWQELRTNYADDYGKGFQAGLLAVIRQPTIDPAPKWIPVTERLPEEGKKVLTLDKWGHIHDRSLYKHMHGVTVFRPDGLSPGKDITHWMPLPGPPDMSNAKMTKENENHG